MTVMPRDSYDWTVDDLDQVPDDGLQYELLDGMLLVTPAPVPDHQRFARGIFRGSAEGERALRLEAPFPVTVTPSTLAG